MIVYLTIFYHETKKYHKNVTFFIISIAYVSSRWDIIIFYISIPYLISSSLWYSIKCHSVADCNDCLRFISNGDRSDFLNRGWLKHSVIKSSLGFLRVFLRFAPLFSGGNRGIIDPFTTDRAWLSIGNQTRRRVRLCTAISMVAFSEMFLMHIV